MNTLSHQDRLEAVFTRRVPDRTPILGGWIACPEHICAIAGVDLDAFWEDPYGVSIRAYQILDTDGIIDICVPKTRTDFRIVDANSYLHAETDLTLEDALAQIEAMPEAAEIEASFDLEFEYAAFRERLIDRRAQCGDMVWMPAQWRGGARVSWYGDYGYQNFFLIVGTYLDHARKLMEVGGAWGYNTGRLVARAVEEGLYPRAVLLGEDICTQRGPMISPAFMERYYAPQLRRGLEPLLTAGCNPIWHSDGDVRPILDMLIDCGIQGFQGFQPECGMTIEYISGKRTREGQPLIIFGPLAVTTELPVLSPAQVRERVRHAIDVCRGNAHLALFTSNTINPDVPLENIRAMYEAAHSS
ncbi:MAG: uroporphyrinogen decarboxylase family protein [Anaerolineae bacterium]